MTFPEVVMFAALLGVCALAGIADMQQGAQRIFWLRHSLYHALTGATLSFLIAHGRWLS